MTIAVAMENNQCSFFMCISPVRVRGPMPAAAKSQTANAAVRRETTILPKPIPQSGTGTWLSKIDKVA
jgi:hypothetical protein